MFPLLIFIIMEHEQEQIICYMVFTHNTEFYKKSVLNMGNTFYNMVPKDIKDVQSIIREEGKVDKFKLGF